MAVKSSLIGKLAILAIAVHICFFLTGASAHPGMMMKPEASTPAKIPVAEASAYDSTYNAITMRLDNGLKVVMIENHATPLITVFVAIKAGSATEDYRHNGITHFLEHMLFNGTTKRTQQELYDEMDLIGGYNNAYTRKDYTAFMITIPSKNIETGMDIQSDMLFNSVISPEKVKKEMGIVSEEIRGSMESPAYAVKANFCNWIYGGTPFEKTVLGTVDGINKLDADDIRNYWRKWYVPNNMIMVVAGDFNPGEMLELIKKYYGKAQPNDIQIDDVILPPITKHERMIDYVPKAARDISIILNAPIPTDDDGIPFMIMVDLLQDELNSYLKKINPSDPIQVSIEHITYKPGCRLIISGKIPGSLTDDETEEHIMDAIQNVGIAKTSQDKLDGVKISTIANEIKMLDNMMIFGLYVLADATNWGWDYIDQKRGKVESVTTDDIDSVRKKYLLSPSFQTYISKPFPAGGLSEKAFDAKWTKEVLPNGLTVAIKQDNSSEVFGMHFLYKNRCYLEPKGKDGIADLLHRTITKGTPEMSADDIQMKMSKLGIDIKTNDYSYIPFDDYCLDPEYSYVRINGLDMFWDESIDFAAGIIVNDGITEDILESSRTGMIHSLGPKHGSARTKAKKAFKNTVMGDSSLTRPIMGTMETVNSITLEDIHDFRKIFFAPDNIILTVTTSIDSEEVMKKIKDAFGGMEFARVKSKFPATKYSGKPSDDIQIEAGGPQSYIIFGYPVNNVPEKDRIPLRALGSIVSKEVAFELRERQGLAYSVGASFNLDDSDGYFYLAMGTGPENIDKAKKGIRDVLGMCKSMEISQRDMELAVNSKTAQMFRYRAKRMNQAYYMGLNLYNGKDIEYDPIDEWYDATLDDILRVRDKYLTPDKGFFVIAK
ncbi:insulinase family protein [bacterium]|nr:insulinase family protein [bacterium]